MDNSGRMSKVDSKSDKKASHGLSDTFPIGLRVLVVEDEQTWLKMLEKMLQKCLYKVTVCSSAVDALSLLRERKHEFDLVTSNVHLPGMDGFKLLEHIRRETDLPVIIISADDDKDAIMKGVISGACDYMIKPVGIETLKNIWQHVVRKRRNEMKELEHSGSVGESDRPQKPSDDTDYASSAIECSFKNIKRRKEEEDEMEERINETSTMKKQRVVWSAELHQQFTAAVNQLGIDKAVPKKLLELMNVPGLTRENVASHLQKYRHRNLGTGVSLPQSILNIPSMGQPEEYLGLMLPRDRLEIQASSVSDELSLQSYAPPQAGGIETSSDKTGMMIIPYIDQVNTSGSEISNLRFGVGQLQLGNNIKQENFFHSHPTTMEPNQLAPWHEPVHSFGNMDLQVAENALSIMKLSLLTGSTCHTGIAPGNQGMSLMSQMIQSHSGHLSSLGQNGTVLNGRGAAYGPVSQASVVDFPMNLVTELPGNGIPLCITAGISTPEPTRMLQAARSLENKGFRSFSQRCDVFNEIQQNIPQDWELQNADQNDNEIPLNISQSFFGNQGFFSSQKTGQNSNTSIAGKEVVTGREENENGNPESMVKFQNNLLDNSLRVKAKSMHNLTGDQNMHLTDHLDENKLLIGQFLKLHQEEVETNFNFDGTPRENVQMWKVP